MRIIALNYILSFFIFDFLACIPGLLTLERSLIVYPFKILRVARIPRLLTFIESIFGMMKEKNMKNQNLLNNCYKVIHTTIILSLILHCMTCGYIAIGMIPYLGEESWITRLGTTNVG